MSAHRLVYKYYSVWQKYVSVLDFEACLNLVMSRKQTSSSSDDIKMSRRKKEKCSTLTKGMNFFLPLVQVGVILGLGIGCRLAKGHVCDVKANHRLQFRKADSHCATDSNQHGEKISGSRSETLIKMAVITARLESWFFFYGVPPAQTSVLWRSNLYERK